MADDAARFEACLAGLLALVALWVAVAAGWRTPLAVALVLTVWGLTEMICVAGILGA